MSDSLWPLGLWPARFLCPWDSPGKDTGVGCHSLLWEIFLTQGWNLGLLHCRQILYCLSYQGNPGKQVPLSYSDPSKSKTGSRLSLFPESRILERQNCWLSRTLLAVSIFPCQDHPSPPSSSLPLIGVAVLTFNKCIVGFLWEVLSRDIFFQYFFFYLGMRKDHSLRPFIHFPSVSS